MNIYRCKDSDGGRDTLIVTENMKKAIELFREMHRYSDTDLGAEPEVIYNMSADGQIVYIDKPFVSEMLECLVKLYKNLNSFGSNISKENSREIIEKVTGMSIDEVLKCY